MKQLQAQADSAMAEVDRVAATYRFSSVGLAANKKLLAHADRVLKPKGSGKKTKSVDIPVERFCQLLREGKGRYSASRALDLDPVDVKRRLQFDQAFRDKVLMAEEEASEKVEEQLWKLATEDGEKWAMELWLKRRYKDRWGDEPQTIKIEGEIRHEIGTGSLMDQIAAIQTVLQNRAELTAGPDHNVIDIDDADIIEEDA